MAKITNLKKALSVVRVDGVPSGLNCFKYPECEMGYLRAYHDDFCWNSAFFTVNSELRTDELVAEARDVVDAVYSAFNDRKAMRRWCRANLDLDPGRNCYIAYYAGEYGAYRLMMKDALGDYNLYIHCYSKEGN